MECATYFTHLLNDCNFEPQSRCCNAATESCSACTDNDEIKWLSLVHDALQCCRRTATVVSGVIVADFMPPPLGI